MRLCGTRRSPTRARSQTGGLYLFASRILLWLAGRPLRAFRGLIHARWHVKLSESYHAACEFFRSLLRHRLLQLVDHS